MINLLTDKYNWVNEFPWGTTIAPFICNSVRELVIWNPDGSVEFHEYAGFVPGWVRDKNWIPVSYTTPYGHGMIISKIAYGYGTFTGICKLPNFKGSWPGFWLADIYGENTIPPEPDVFEQFRKDCFFTRFKITTTYHDGPTYETGKAISKSLYRIYPYDWGWNEIILEWLPESMTTKINGRISLKIMKKDYPCYPTGKMNVLLNSCIGEWKPKISKFPPFIVKTLTYEPYNSGKSDS